MDEFDKYLLQTYQSPARVDTLSEIEKAAKLDELIEEYLILIAAQSQGLEKELDFELEVERYRKKLIFDRLIEKVVIDSLLTLSRMRDFYEKYGGEIRIQELLVRAPLPRFFKSRQDSLLDAEASQAAQELYQKILSGEGFAHVAAQFSQKDENKKQVQVIQKTTGYVRWGRLSKEIQDTAFQLEVGEISEPIRTGFGYHIIQLLDKKKRSFEADKEIIKHQLAAVYARTIQERKEKYLRQLENKYRIFLHNENIHHLANAIEQGWKIPGSFEQSIEQMRLASFSGGEIRAGHFFQVMRNNLQNFRGNSSKIKTWAAQATLMAVAGMEAKEYDIDVRNEVRAYRTNLLIQTMRARAVSEGIFVSDQELRDYYESHRGEFVTPLQVHVREILVQEPYLATHIKRLVAAGKDFGQLADEHTIRVKARGKGGDLGFVSLYVYSDIFEAVKDLEVGSIHGPFQITEGLSIVQILDRRIEEPLPFEEMKEKIYHLVKNEKQKRRYTEWLAELAAKYPPVFHRNYPDSRYQRISKYAQVAHQF